MKTYEEMYPIIYEVVEKRRNRYALDGIAWQEWEDVRQIILNHIHKKWHLWNQERKLRPWVCTVAVNQIRNIIRSNYLKFVPPCTHCPNYSGGDICDKTGSLTSKTNCKEYNEWVLDKQAGYGLKMTLPMETHLHEIESKEQGGDVDYVFEELLEYLESRFTETDMYIFRNSFLEGKNDKKIAEESGKIYPRKIPIQIIISQKELVKKAAIEFLKKHQYGEEEE